MHRTSLSPAMLLGMMVLAIGPAQADDTRVERLTTLHHELRLERIASGLETPWAVVELPDGRYLISERAGRLALVNADGGISRLEKLPEVSDNGQGGLLDIVLHPQYGDGEHDWVYFTWSRTGDDGTATSLSRARLAEGHLENIERLFTQDRFSTPGRHYGSRLAWLDDGTLLMSIGDRGVDPERAQDGRDHAGSILRLTAEGTVPADNPFIDAPQIDDEIFSLGHRNPQGLVIAEDGTPWSTEHGPRTGDELNRLVAGENYGWPEVTLGRDYAPINHSARTVPRHARSGACLRGAFRASGLTDITGDVFPGWHGNLMAGGLASEQLTRLSLEDDTVAEREVILDGEIGRVRDIHQARMVRSYCSTMPLMRTFID